MFRYDRTRQAQNGRHFPDIFLAVFLTATLRPSTHTPVSPSTLSPLKPSFARVLMTVSSRARRYQWMSWRYRLRFMIGYMTICGFRFRGVREVLPVGGGSERYCEGLADGRR